MSTTDQLEAQIAQQREALAQTADALSQKLDVKGRVSDKADHLRDAATTDSGRPRPLLIGVVAAGLAAAAALVYWRRTS